jgi:hypothetical protein
MGAGVGGQTVSRLFFAGISQANPKRSSRIAGKEEVELGGSWVGGKTGCSYPPRAFIAAHLARQRAWKVLLVLWPGAQISFGILRNTFVRDGYGVPDYQFVILVFIISRLSRTGDGDAYARASAMCAPTQVQMPDGIFRETEKKTNGSNIFVDRTRLCVYCRSIPYNYNAQFELSTTDILVLLNLTL